MLNLFKQISRTRLLIVASCLLLHAAAVGVGLLTHRPVGTNDILKLNMQADASDAAAGAEFVVKNLSIRAAKIVKGK